LGAFPLLDGPPLKKAKRTIVPEDRFDIFEHFFSIDDSASQPESSATPTALPNAYAAYTFAGEAAPPAKSTMPDGDFVTEQASSSNSINSDPINFLAPTDANQNKRKCTPVNVDACNFLSVFHVPLTQDMRPPGVHGQGAAPGIIGPPPIGTPRDPIA